MVQGTNAVAAIDQAERATGGRATALRYLLREQDELPGNVPTRRRRPRSARSPGPSPR